MIDLEKSNFDVAATLTPPVEVRILYPHPIKTNS
jgi:hypothetical protein